MKSISSWLLPVVVLFSGCAQNEQTSQLARIQAVIERMGGASTPASIQVTDRSHQPISGAKVLIGHALDAPFSGNFLTTGPDGTFAAPTSWIDPLPLTIEAPGYIRTTFVGALPNQSFQLNESAGSDRIEFSGVTLGWPKLKKDGFVDFAIVLPKIDRTGLHHFSISDLLSPEVDTMKAYGKDISLPSNFSIPKQSENYSLFPVTLDKLPYRSFVRKSALYEVSAAKAKFPFNKVLSEIKNGKNYFDVLNLFEFIGTGFQTFSIGTQTTNFDVPTTPYIFDPLVTVESEVLPKGTYQFALLWSLETGQYAMTDAKRLSSQETAELKGITSRPATLLSIIGTQKNLKGGLVTLENQMSRVIKSSAAASLKPRHLELIPTPQFDGIQTLSGQTPSPAKGLTGFATYAVLSDVEITESETQYYELKTPLWEVYSTDWKDRIVIPSWPDPIGNSVTKRWDLSFMATDAGSPVVPLGPEVLDLATHATQNSVDF